MSKSYTAYDAKPDGNQSAIVAELRGLGFDVDLVHRLKGLYDLVVTGIPTWADRPVAVRVEVKVGKAKLSPAEADYWSRQRHSDNLIRANCADDVIAWFGR
jgi:hypothetical protein